MAEILNGLQPISSPNQVNAVSETNLVKNTSDLSAKIGRLQIEVEEIKQKQGELAILSEKEINRSVSSLTQSLKILDDQFTQLRKEVHDMEKKQHNIDWWFGFYTFFFIIVAVFLFFRRKTAVLSEKISIQQDDFEYDFFAEIPDLKTAFAALMKNGGNAENKERFKRLIHLYLEKNGSEKKKVLAVLEFYCDFFIPKTWINKQEDFVQFKDFFLQYLPNGIECEFYACPSTGDPVGQLNRNEFDIIGTGLRVKSMKVPGLTLSYKSGKDIVSVSRRPKVETF